MLLFSLDTYLLLSEVRVAAKPGEQEYCIGVDTFTIVLTVVLV